MFAYDDNEVSSVYGFKSSYTYEDFVLKKKNNSGVRTTSNQEDKRHNVGSAFDLRPYANNDELFSLVGLTQSVRTKHFNDYIDSPLLKVGILEAEGGLSMVELHHLYEIINTEMVPDEEMNHFIMNLEAITLTMLEKLSLGKKG
ncbi:hypothetical protein JM47_01995 [Ureaplasma diversum]|uniref:Uncharacterized protein n=1 Tax=Ureaplasma diversum TaxID=42094 RepID=A0A0C5RBY2_9BACT|nr:hypothetical protein [Ureaplasma diversum]AJQ45361.1 hypothetical protein JM47_01995 [Ureaplasma diversum]